VTDAKIRPGREKKSREEEDRGKGGPYAKIILNEAFNSASSDQGGLRRGGLRRPKRGIRSNQHGRLI